MQVQSPIGTLCISATEQGIIAVSFDHYHLSGNAAGAPYEQACAQQLAEYFAGNRRTFDLLLAPAGTAFQQRVWQSLLDIPYGRSISYQQQALALQDIKAIRAMATANGSNPIAILIPCHRVVGADGSLTGYGGGLWRKQWLLQHEQGARQAALF